ncbi:deoxyribonuclease-1 [Spea bombifrons]|uniref:deoxyribonuclease-1 n=1 Tax=Spea bombifrons TaxID=233779 RepID=UPI00234A0897|nr:deoxyribonuclease-1 [Spea bombifrons]
MWCFAIGLTLALSLSEVSGLKIGAFNIQAFGDSKMKNPAVAPVLMKILPRYDIVLIQEVRDTDLSAVKMLMQKLNSLDSGSVFSYVISDTLGRDSYTEQYLFIYRNDKVSVRDSYHYHDHNMYTDEDTFSREPFVVMFHAPDTAIENFVLVPLHSAPKDAVREIDALYDVYEDVWNKWETDNIIFLGDFNAACNYVTSSDWERIRLWTDEAFSWLIEDSVDTTAGATNCAYDRIVVSGSEMQEAIVPNSAKVFNFQKKYKLTQEEALAVSDHYPVEVELKS